MKTDLHWIPAAFCALISIIVPLGSQLSGWDSGTWEPAFYSFLPLCFYWVGTVTSQMHREIRELRSQLTELQQQQK